MRFRIAGKPAAIATTSAEEKEAGANSSSGPCVLRPGEFLGNGELVESVAAEPIGGSESGSSPAASMPSSFVRTMRIAIRYFFVLIFVLKLYAHNKGANLTIRHRAGASIKMRLALPHPSLGANHPANHP